METNRYIVSVNVVVEATTEEEASLFVERALAGRFDHEVIDVHGPEAADFMK